LHVQEFGEGPAVVLLHAFPCDGRMWLPQARALADAGHHVIVPDLPGFGRSPLLPGPPSLPAVAEAVLARLDDDGVESAVLGGISLGGYVSMAILRQRPGLASGLILCDTKATADTAAAQENRERLAQMCLAAPDDVERILEQAVLPGLLGETSRVSRPDVVAEVRTWLGAATAGSVAWYQRAMAARPDSREVLAGLDVPALVIYGDEDALSPAGEQELMAQALADPRIVVVSGAGHLANVELPERVADALVEFLA
jgi:pimeloyl-ACP methyl ester carboxylesterase